MAKAKAKAKEKAPPPAAAAAPRRRGVVVRKDGRELKRVCLYFPAQLAGALAVYCASNDRDASDVASEAVAKFLGT
jgi:hypothetical protein